ncbi:hypothetical protein KR222_004255 [Zaprionus bogoriensis]|nr:hypothetical protein KR222_004255 [Zaprionus bogoriensis]
MALEQYCGLNKLPFMQEDVNAEFAQIDVKIARGIFDNPYSLLAPPFENPVQNLNEILKRNHLTLDMTHGTTTLGFKYQGGIILCADSRNTRGSYITSQESQKIVELDKCMLGTIAGGAADCTYWDRVLAMECRLYRLENNDCMPVTSASCIIRNVAHRFKGMGLCMGMMLAGYDLEGPKLIYVDSDGQRTEGNSFSVGSGCINAFGVFDTNYRHDMSDQEAHDLALRSIYHSSYLDSFSGGLVRLYHIQRSGWRMVSVNDCTELHDNFLNETKDERGSGAEVQPARV